MLYFSFQYLKVKHLYSSKYKVMFKNTIILLLFLLSGQYICAQESYSKFTAVLNTIDSPGARAKYILEYEQSSDISYHEEYTDFLEEAINYYLGQNAPDTILNLVTSVADHYIFSHQVNHQKAKEVLDLVIPYQKLISDTTAWTNYLVQRGEIAIYNNNFDDAIDIFKTILDVAVDTTQYSYSYAHLKLGEVYANHWNILKSIIHFNKASDLFLKQENVGMYLWTQSGLASLYSLNSLYKEANNARNIIYKVGVENKAFDIVTIAHLTAAMENKERNNQEKRLYHLKQANEYSKHQSTVQDYVKAVNYTFHTLYYTEKRQIDSSEFYFKKLENLYSPDKHGAWVKSYYLIGKASNYHLHGNYTAAENIILQLIKDAKTTRKASMRLRFYETLSTLYNEWGKRELELQALKNYSSLKDSLEDLRINNQFLYYNQLFESEKKDKTILQQEASIQLLSAQNKLILMRWAIVVLVIGVIFTVFYFYKSRKFAIQKNKLQENFSQRLISSQELEKSKISRDLHDGLSQQLILIKNRLDILGYNDVSEMVSGSLDELRSITRSLHPAILSNFGLTAALEYLCTNLNKYADDIEVSHHIERIDNLLDEEHELHLYRIVQEILNNILKHAECSTISISILPKKKDIFIRIQDNGKGFELEEAEISGLGMNSIRERSKIIGGHLEIQSKKNKGTVITLKIPVYERHKDSISR